MEVMKKYNIYMISILFLCITLSLASKYESFSNSEIKTDVLSTFKSNTSNKLLAYADRDIINDDMDSLSTLSGEEYIIEIDNTAPTIKSKKSITTTVGKKVNLLKNVTVSDDSDDDIELTVEGEYDLNTVGKYTLKYIATDSSKNRSEKEFTLIVKEKVVTTAVVETPATVEVTNSVPAVSGNVRNDMVQIALSQLGNYNGNPYWSWYGFSGRVEWCACFVSWVSNQAGVLNTYVPKFASTGVGMRWFKSHGQWRNRDYTPQAGDIIFFDYAHNGRVEHVGIVEKVVDGRVYTIEGNTNKNKVENRSYPANSLSILGYGVPAY